MTNDLRQKKMLVESILTKSESTLSSELEKIEEYYGQFYQIIDEHKNSVVEEVRSEYENAC